MPRSILAKIITMGQYYKGKKIGTCESMYYMRLQEAQELALQGASDDDGIKFEEMLKDNTTRFRFPFPNEDGKSLHDVSHEIGYNLPADGVSVDHGTICVSNSFNGAGNSVNIFLPCPYSQEFNSAGLKMSIGGAGEQFVAVLYQAMRDGKEKTIFACARCGEQQRFSDEDVEKIRERSREYFEPYNREGKSDTYGGNQGLYDNAMEIIKRIR